MFVPTRDSFPEGAWADGEIFIAFRFEDFIFMPTFLRWQRTLNESLEGSLYHVYQRPNDASSSLSNYAADNWRWPYDVNSINWLLGPGAGAELFTPLTTTHHAHSSRSKKWALDDARTYSTSSRGCLRWAYSECADCRGRLSRNNKHLKTKRKIFGEFPFWCSRVACRFVIYSSACAPRGESDSFGSISVEKAKFSVSPLDSGLFLSIKYFEPEKSSSDVRPSRNRN